MRSFSKVDPKLFQSRSIFRLCSWVLTKGEEEVGLIAAVVDGLKENGIAGEDDVKAQAARTPHSYILTVHPYA